MATSPCPVSITTGGETGRARSVARNSSPSMPGIFTSVTMHIASRSPGQARAASAEEKTSTAQPRRLSIWPMECRAASSSSMTTMSAPFPRSPSAVTRRSCAGPAFALRPRAAAS